MPRQVFPFAGPSVNLISILFGGFSAFKVTEPENSKNILPGCVREVRESSLFPAKEICRGSENASPEVPRLRYGDNFVPRYSPAIILQVPCNSLMSSLGFLFVLGVG